MVSRHDSWSDLVRCLVDQHQQRKRAARVEARESGFNACMCVFDSFSEAAKTGIIAMMLTSIANVARKTLIALSSLGDVRNIQSGRNQADSKAYRHVDARVQVQQGEGGEQGVSRQQGGMLFGMQRKRGRSVEDTVVHFPTVLIERGLVNPTPLALHTAIKRRGCLGGCSSVCLNLQTVQQLCLRGRP
jgi:hypothetical protein